jgi:hypothetical protein
MKKGVLIINGDVDVELQNAIRMELLSFLNGRSKEMPLLTGCMAEFVPYVKGKGIMTFEGDLTQEDILRVQDGRKNNKSVVLFGNFSGTFISL